MYMLCLGASRPSVNGSFVSKAPPARNLAPQPDTDMETESLGVMEEDGDVE